jgi:UDP-N-acetylmuramoylalanine-D-glutamate ligase
VAVVEVSSYQMELPGSFHPKVIDVAGRCDIESDT